MRKPEDVKVLVVDDDPDVRLFLSSVLADAGMRVELAADGNAALERIRAEAPDLISLDLVMPGKSGIKLLLELRRHTDWARIPVVIVTGHARDETVQRDLTSVLADSSMTGPSLYLEKPVTPERYLEHICKVLGVEQAAPEQDRTTELRRELEELLRGADEAALEAAVQRLRARTSKQG